MAHNLRWEKRSMATKNTPRGGKAQAGKPKTQSSAMGLRNKKAGAAKTRSAGGANC